ncbi:hypothetical protein COR50_05940 [Chitinophaga caeni]|uniref:histidine kinase n=2 Tax=Chitinophaga caeni TaxID=2029983 RepID=A0A291QS65_9BACT|nr:hypothetical protein COR50_05940 [Chitinophaga caeni]
MFMMKTLSIALIYLCTLLPTAPSKSQVKTYLSPEESVNDSTKLVDHYNFLASKYATIQLDSSYYYCSLAKNLADRIDYTKGKGMAMHNIGIYHTLRNNWISAANYYAQALDQFEETGDTENTVITMSDIASSYYFYQNREEEAIYFFREAIRRGAHLAKDSVNAYAWINYYSILQKDSTKLDSAKLALEEAKRIALKYHDQRIILYTELIEATHEFDTLRWQAGEKKFISLADSAIAMRDHYLAIQAYCTVCQLLYPVVPDTAIKFYQKAYDLGLESGYFEALTDVAYSLFSHYMKHGQEDKALQLADTFINNAHRAEQLKKEQRHFNLEYLLKNSENTNETLANNNRKLALSVMVILAVFLIIITFIFYSSYRKARQYAILMKNKNDEITEKNKQLNNEAEFKNKLLSIIAHDFRTPLANIIQLAAVHKDQPFDNASLGMMLDAISTTSQTTLDLFENTLRWIKSQLPGFIYQPVPLSVNILIDSAVDLYNDEIRQKHLQLRENISPETGILADKEMVQFVNRNLIHNAIKFSPQNGSIEINTAQNEGKVSISIKNTGFQLNGEQLGHLFEIQGDSASRNNQFKGAGVALIICKDFIEKMGGTINAFREGDFTVFQYELPGA